MGILQARILEWVAMPSSRGYSQPRDRTQVACIAGGFITVCATKEAHHQMVTTKIRLIKFFAAKDGEAHTVIKKQDQELTLAQIMNSLSPNSDLN